MSRSQRLYRALIEAVPVALVDALDHPLTDHRTARAVQKDAARFAGQVKIPSRWYATDGTAAFYLFRKKATAFSNGELAFVRSPVTVHGTTAEQAWRRHEGRLTDRRPAGWVSAATAAAAHFGGYDGGPEHWGWQDDDDLDLDIKTAARLRAEHQGPFLHGPLADFADRVLARTGRA